MIAHHTWAIVLIAGMMKVRAPDPTPFRNGPTTLVDSRQLMGVASNEAEEAGASSLFCIRTYARIGDVL